MSNWDGMSDVDDGIDIDPDAVTPMWLDADGRLTLTPQYVPVHSSPAVQAARGEATIRAREFALAQLSGIDDDNERVQYLDDLITDLYTKLEELRGV